MNLETRLQRPNGVIKHANFKYDIFSGLFEARSAEHEVTKFAKRPL